MSSPHGEIDPIAGADVDPELAYAIADRLHITKQPAAHADDPLPDDLDRLAVTQTIEPLVEICSGRDLVLHVAYMRQ